MSAPDLPRPEESIAVDRLHAVRPLRLCPQYPSFQRIHFISAISPGLIRWLTDCDPDALILEANPRYLATAAAIRWMKRRGRPVLGWGLGAPNSAFLAVRCLGTEAASTPSCAGSMG